MASRASATSRLMSMTASWKLSCASARHRKVSRRRPLLAPVESAACALGRSKRSPSVVWSASTCEALGDGEKLIVLLRDGRKLLGTLCSFDQFANVVLQGACERVIVGEQYCDVPLGLYVIRGENVVLIGELDREKDELPAHMTCVSEAEIRKAEKAEREARDLKGTMRKRMEFLDFD
ncbi:Sm-like protein LSM1B [Dichanthelium oligosanthes]|uniref:U6 snRNA-associated Sm-like protein LSm1 n=1 Tax=Dichanthelium oligosanthes TaxID=888268 RepID=A0A1E5VUG1_9POAL|nr:Sm-like protein LSM1B [Dichanthelium oligosanthes]